MVRIPGCDLGLQRSSPVGSSFEAYLWGRIRLLFDGVLSLIEIENNIHLS